MSSTIVLLIFSVGLSISVWLWVVEGFVSFLVMLVLTFLVGGFVAFVLEIAAAIGRWLCRL